MDNLTLNRPQIQLILDNLVKKDGGVNTLLELTLNSFMKAERSNMLKTSQNNKGNGYRKINALGIGEGLNLSLPRDRLGHFKPLILEIMQEQQSDINDLFFELYAKGLSTRDLEDISKTIYGKHLSRSSISRITKEFYGEMSEYLARPIDDYYPVIYIDATFIKTKRDTVSSEAYYVILGVKPDSSREVIGIYNAPTEGSSIWEDIFLDLKSRGLKKTNLFVTDNLPGIDLVIEKHFKAKIQKCVLHLKRDILRRVKKIHRAEVAEDLKEVFQLELHQDSQKKSLERAQICAKKWQKLYSHMKVLADENKMQYYFRYLDYHPKIRNMIYTTNWIERLNKDFKRTIKIRNSMPSVESVLTLMAKVSMSLNESRYSYQIHRLKFDKMFDKEE